jgi:hypothetical protein
LQGFQPCVFSYHGTKKEHNDNEEREVGAGEDDDGDAEDDAVSEAGVRNMSLEPATRDVSLEGEHTQDEQPVKEEVEEQPKRVPPLETRFEGDPPTSAQSSGKFL